MKTKRLFTALMMATMMSCGIILAQSPTLKEKKITEEQRIEMRVKQMQKKLFLDEETSAKFVPLYKEYLEAMKQCMPIPKPAKKEDMQELTDTQIDKMMQEQFANRKKLIEIQETYYSKFKKILNIRQVEALFKHDTPKRINRPGPEKRQTPPLQKNKREKVPAPIEQESAPQD